MPRAPFVCPSGTVYDLSHLEPYILHCPYRAPDGAAITTKFLTTFSSHVFSRERKENDNDEWDYIDGRDLRYFCTERYAMSLRLPEILKTLGNRRCERSWSKKGVVNFVTVEGIDNSRYAVYFNVGSDSRQLRLRIRSAYILDQTRRHPGDGNRFVFAAIVREALRNRIK